MQPDEMAMDDIVSSVLAGAAGYGVDGGTAKPAAKGDCLRAEVRFLGDWTGCVRVDMRPELARLLAGAMLHRPMDDVDEVTSMDAVGELANMIAGHLRPPLEGARSLGVPTVMRRSLSEASDGALLDRNFECAGRQISVRLLAEPQTRQH
jgi:CheY-specific phosphatase CheX